MTAVTTIKPNLLAVSAPEVLRNLPGWLMWRYEHHEGETKPRKVPYYTGGGKRYGVQGRPEDRQQLTTFDAARAAAARKGFDGVGFCPMPEWGICALDFDKCVTANGVHPDVQDVVGHTYAEYSPSGEGVRAFVRGNLGNRKAHGAPFGFETFSSKGFVTFTGNRLDIVDLVGTENTVAEAGPAVQALCAQRFGRAEADPLEAAINADVPPIGLTLDQLREALDVLDPSMGHEPWLAVGMALHHETGGDGFDLWDEWSSKGHQYPGTEALQRRWDSFGKGGQRPTTAHRLVNMANEHGAHIDLNALAMSEFENLEPEEANPATQKPSRFAVIPVLEFSQRPPPEWIIKGVVPRAELLVLFGESGSGKSFIALDLAGAICRGLPWRGCRTKPGRVVYVAAEGAGGFRNRVIAYAAKLPDPSDLRWTDKFGVIHAAPNLLLKDDALDVCKSIIASGGADVVIIDTFAQTTPGANENAAEDMGKALAHCKGIHRATGALVMLVHHSGKDASKGARGWSGLKAAADAELEVVRTPTGRMLRVSKQKDGEDGLAWGFDLDPVTVGIDSDGDEITSCVVRETEVPMPSSATAKPMGPIEAAVNAVLQEMAQVQTVGIEVAAVIVEAAKRLPAPEDGKRDTRKQRAKRALDRLCEGDESPYWLDGQNISIV